MCFDRLRTWNLSFALAMLVVSPSVSSASDELESGAPATIGSPSQVAEEILQLRQTFGSAWREVGGEATPETTAAEEGAIRTALLDQARSHSKPDSIRPPQTDSRRTELRESAHQLDLVAHALECQELYDEADELRGVAQRLRERARQQQPVVLGKVGKNWKPVAREAAD